jgi:hypothetical protein
MAVAQAVLIGWTIAMFFLFILDSTAAGPYSVSILLSLLTMACSIAACFPTVQESRRAIHSLIGILWFAVAGRLFVMTLYTALAVSGDLFWCYDACGTYVVMGIADWVVAPVMMCLLGGLTSLHCECCQCR